MVVVCGSARVEVVVGLGCSCVVVTGSGEDVGANAGALEVDEGGGGGGEDLLGEDDERTKPLVTAAGEDDELFEDATRVDEVVGRGDVTLVMTLDGTFPTLAMAAVGPTAAEDEDARDLQAQSSINPSRRKHN